MWGGLERGCGMGFSVWAILMCNTNKAYYINLNAYCLASQSIKYLNGFGFSV